MNPPYNHVGQRPSPDLLKSEAHVMGLFGLDAWMRTAVAILKPGGDLSMIYRSEKIGEVYACCQGRFGGLVVVPVHARADEAAKRILVRMTKGSRAPLSIMPGIVMHNADGTATDQAEALMNGEARVNYG
jgi:tRNA1(Val) A37 N6-methylase TrmN6